jgi:L-threonylcarbamoyladenylate synthase
MAQIETDIEKAKALLESGELVAIPTETVYGLAGNALNPDAVAKIFSVKNRPSFDPLIIHTDSLEKVRKFTLDIPAPLDRLAAHFWPGPLTLLLPKKPIVPDLVTSGLDTVAVRIPQHTLTLSLLEALDFPLAAPSANPFGYISPTTAAHVQDQLGDKIPYILDGGPSQVGLESTIVGLENGEVVVYRLGGLEVAAIESNSRSRQNHGPLQQQPKVARNAEKPLCPKGFLCLGGFENTSPDVSEKRNAIWYSFILEEVPRHPRAVPKATERKG